MLVRYIHIHNTCQYKYTTFLNQYTAEEEIRKCSRCQIYTSTSFLTYDRDVQLFINIIIRTITSSLLSPCTPLSSIESSLPWDGHSRNASTTQCPYITLSPMPHYPCASSHLLHNVLLSSTPIEGAHPSLVLLISLLNTYRNGVSSFILCMCSSHTCP